MQLDPQAIKLVTGLITALGGLGGVAALFRRWQAAGRERVRAEVRAELERKRLEHSGNGEALDQASLIANMRARMVDLERRMAEMEAESRAGCREHGNLWDAIADIRSRLPPARHKQAEA